MSTVLKDFVCKETGKLYKAGDTYEGNRTEALAKLGYVAEDAQKSLDDMTKAELLQFAEENKVEGVNSSMTKAEIVEAIKAVG